MRSWTSETAAFVESALACNDAPSLTEAFRASLARYGLSGFVCGETDLRNRARTVFHVVEWPRDLLALYEKEGLVEADPVIGALQRRSAGLVRGGPFTWTEIRQEGPRTRAAARVYEAAQLFGWREGLVVPLPRGGSRVGLISLHGDSGRLTDERRAELCAISVFYYERLRGMLAGTERPRSIAGLTPRELDCLAYVAAGLNDSLIGERLGIAQTTAHEHVERAKRRLGVRTRAEAVAIAVSLGLLVP